MRLASLAALVAAFCCVAAPANASSQHSERRTLPVWSTSVTDPTTGFVSKINFVGSNPSLGTSTTIPTELVAVNFKFPFSGRTLKAGQDVSNVIHSPIFNSLSVSPTNGDVSQAGDWIQRVQFNAVGTGYHVLLGLPTVYTATITVPFLAGETTFNKRHVMVGKVDINWLDSVVQSIIASAGFAPNTLPIILSHNVFAYDGGDVTHCCIMGYHNSIGTPVDEDPQRGLDSATKQPQTTYIYSSYITPRSFRNFPTEGISDINALSHEVSEWMNDPFTDSRVQKWSVPDEPQYGCSDWFETGDPLVGVSAAIPGNPAHNAGGAWHVQDEAFVNWFTHDGATFSPPGLYSWLGTFKSPSEGCHSG